MPFKDPEKTKEYNKKYRRERKLTHEQIEHSKEWRRRYENNDTEWLEENKRKSIQITKEKLTKLDNRQRDMNKRVNQWKRLHNIKSADWNYVYDKYINTLKCDFCNITFDIGTMGNDKRCLDHHHSSGEIRDILCNRCNSKRKKVDLNFMYVLQELHRYFRLNQM